jgi:hypothetical protein
MKKIALLSIPEPGEVPVANLGGAAGAFGCIGGLVQADVNLGQAKQFAEYRNSTPVTSYNLLSVNYFDIIRRRLPFARAAMEKRQPGRCFFVSPSH